jgi:uncharacterized membrane protein
MALIWYLFGIFSGMTVVAVLSWMTDREFDARPPVALSDAEVARLERAIRAKGYRVLHDPESGEIKLETRRA